MVRVMNGREFLLVAGRSQNRCEQCTKICWACVRRSSPSYLPVTRSPPSLSAVTQLIKQMTEARVRLVAKSQRTVSGFSRKSTLPSSVTGRVRLAFVKNAGEGLQLRGSGCWHTLADASDVSALMQEDLTLMTAHCHGMMYQKKKKLVAILLSIARGPWGACNERER
jgi:hypothetical protein